MAQSEGGRGAADAGATLNWENEPEEERIPAMQHLLDNHFLLLFLGIALPTVLYILWGVMEILSLPNAPQ
ncbi:MAG TPA: hypothetical protein VFB54_12480 [Burkholderiales bacterium]|nr:hypothetical protein [Burkholderiales bacterium]